MITKIIGSLFKKNNSEVESPGKSIATSSDEVDLITVYDKYGRELKITKNEWREKILGPNLEKAWNNPDELYGFIVSALNDGFVNDIVDASSRLLTIDTMSERSYAIRGIVLMKIGRADDAATILRAGIDKVGETGTLLTNLAKVYAEQGDTNRSDQTLWRSIQIDPNQENGLLWWAAIQRERNGEQGFFLALQNAAAIAGSWRPQLWLARHHLEHRDIDKAKALYEFVLHGKNYSTEALMMISGDLGNNGQVALIPEIVAPAYDPEKHDPRAGINLVQAYLQLGRRQDGEALLSRLYALDLPPYKQHFDHYASELQKIQRQDNLPKPIDSPEDLEIETLSIENPIWSRGFHNPTWLFATKNTDAPRVMFLSFAKCTQTIDKAEVQNEDDLGRLSRAIPLYLTESVHYWTDLQSATLIPVVKGGGPVVFGAGGNDAALCETLGSNGAFLVTGDIDGSGEKWRIVCRLWNCATRTCLLEERFETALEDIGPAVLQLEKRILAELGQLRATPFDDFYSRPTQEVITPYLVALGQSFTLSLISNEAASKDSLWGERNILEWPLRMALEWPETEIPKLMYLSGLAKAASYHSDIVHEFKTRTLEFIKDARKTNSVAAKLEPIVWKIFGMTDELKHQLAALSSDVEEEYRQWLLRVIADSDTDTA
ncbi:MAG TPA: hypothetical protein VLC79_06670 [Cellvibrio sp.]|nr:hypothetical protein [Cellvibrio sp.]